MSDTEVIILGVSVMVGGLSIASWFYAFIYEPWEEGEGVPWWTIAGTAIAPLLWACILLWLLIRFFEGVFKENRRRLGVRCTACHCVKCSSSHQAPSTGIYR